jgi:hypothetical protein
VKRAAALWVLISATAFAEAGWLSARGRLLREVRVEAWAGTNSAGAGFVRPDAERATPSGPTTPPGLSEPVIKAPGGNGDGPTAALTAELAYAWRHRTLELRGARLWQLTPTRTGTLSAFVGGAAHVVPEGRFDLGVGPHAGLTLSLGGSVCTVDLGLQTGAELFFAPVLARFPQRAQLSLNFVLGPLALGLHARLGVDLVTAQPFVGRGELALSLGWLFASSPASSAP